MHFYRKISVLINGSPEGFLSPKGDLDREIHCLFLFVCFVLVMEVLSKMLKKASNSGCIKGFGIEDNGRNVLEVGHI